MKFITTCHQRSSFYGLLRLLTTVLYSYCTLLYSNYAWICGVSNFGLQARMINYFSVDGISMYFLVEKQMSSCNEAS